MTSPIARLGRVMSSHGGGRRCSACETLDEIDALRRRVDEQEESIRRLSRMLNDFVRSARDKRPAARKAIVEAKPRKPSRATLEAIENDRRGRR